VSQPDLVAELRPEHASSLISALRDGYYVPEERVRDGIARQASFNVIHLATMIKVDVFVAKDRPFDRQALGRARAEPLGADGRLVPLASAEDVILAKLEWYRRGGEVSERQWGDVMGVLKASATALERSYLRRGSLELGVADLLVRALDEAKLPEK
jgi:hypothetical protein